MSFLKKLSETKVKDSDFMGELEAAAHMRPAKASIYLLLAIIALILFFFLWAAFAEVEEISRGNGKVVPSQEIQVVQSLEGGILEDILVRQGELVEQGQILLRISDVQFSSEERGTEARFLALSAKKARLEAEVSGEEFVVPEAVEDTLPQIAANERELYQSRLKELQNAYDILDNKIAKAQADLKEAEERIKSGQENLGLLEEELTITSRMVAQRAMPKLEEIRLQRQISETRGEIEANRQRKNSLQAELARAEKERQGQEDKFRSESLEELNDVESQIAELREDLKSLEDKVQRAELRSPVEGVINSIAVTTIGGVVEPAMRLVEIVPVDDELKIIAEIPPDEIAFLRPGQPAKVNITAYDPQKYGALDGELTRIGANSVQDNEGNIFFEIEVRTEKNFMGSPQNPLPITPGMVAEVEIITGKRSILEYLLKPLLRAKDRAFTER